MYKFYPKIFVQPPGCAAKTLLTMKITALLLFLAVFQVSASTFAQQVTLSEKNASLNQVFDHIRQQTGYDFLLNKDVLKNASPVDIDIRNADLKVALEKIFATQAQSLEYEITDKMVLVKLKESNFFQNFIKAFNAFNIRGKVVDDKGLPVPGATVSLKDKSQATTTDINGAFILQRVDEKAVLVISSIGFLTQELNAKPDMGVIFLEVSNSKLDEVVVVGYETTTRRLSTGSVSQVKSAELEQQPISNPVLALQGHVSGAFITQTAGYAGAPVNVVIRGQNSFASVANLAQPLYVVDGVPFNSTPVEQTAGGFGTTVFSPLNTIDPTLIESIDVLKDADATAIYGSRGANGVVLITTKKGKAGNAKFDVDLSSGFGDVSRQVPFLNTDQYLALRRQAFANDGVVPTVSSAPDLTQWDQRAYTNFGKLLFGNTQHQTRATFGLSGGDQFTQFLLGGNYRHESTVFNSHTADNAEQVHLSVQHQSHDHKFGVNTSASYHIDNNTIPNYQLSNANYGLPPNFPIYNGDGSLYSTATYTNPLLAFNGTVNLKSNNLISNVGLHYLITPDLDLKVNAGYNYDEVFGTTIVPESASNPLFTPFPIAQLNSNYIKTYIAEPQLNYAHTWGKGKLSAILGGTWQETQFTQPYFILGTFTNVQLATSLAALTVLSKSSGSTDYKYNSGFARVEYAWDGKYLVSANFRRDGSSRFGAEKPFGNFGSGAVAWIFSKEGFVSEHLPWLSFGKLKASYGSVGNDKTISDYAYQSTYFAGTAYGPTTSLSATRIANPYLQWEQTNKLDVALEIGLLKDRIFFSANYYRNRTDHMLGTVALTGQTGFTSYSANLPDGAVVQNKGVEVELATVNIKTKQVTWKTSFNFTAAQNILLSFPNITTSSYANTYVVGQSLNLINVYHSTGIVNGIATAQDVNGDGRVSFGISANGKGDYIVAGNRDPKYYGGLSNTLIYKGFQLDFLFQFVKRVSTRGDLNLGVYPGMGGNLPATMLDIPLRASAISGSAASTAYQYYATSDAAIQDASYIRLKNVSLGYNFPAAWARKLKMSSLQFYLHAENLLTFTSYKGSDPETLSNNLPTLRMMVAGVKTSF